MNRLAFFLGTGALLASTALYATDGKDFLPAVSEALATPVLKGAGLSTYRAVLGQVETADQAADQAFLALTTPANLTDRQRQLRARLLASFGGFPERRTPLNARVTGTVARDGYRIEKVLFESQPGLFVTAHLFLPDASAFKPPYPGILICCGHSNDGKAADAYQRGGVLAAQSGFAALIYDPIDQGERLQLPGKHPPNNVNGHNLIGVRAMLLGWNTARFRIWDGMRALDYLQSRPEVNPQRLGVMGNSGGGTLSSYLMALDDRIGAAAPSCFLTTLRDVCEHCGPQDAEQNFFGQLAFGVNHAGYVLLRAPSPVCLNCSREDFFPFAGSQKTFSVARRVCGRFDWGDRVAMLDVPGPHGWKEGARRGSIQWMRRWLADDASALPLDLEALRAQCAVFDPKKADCGLREPDAWVTPTGQVRDLPGARSAYDLLRDEFAAAEQTRRATTTDARRRRACELAGIRAPASLQVVPSHPAIIQHEGVKEIRQSFARPSGIALPTVTFIPDRVTGTPVLVVDAAGKTNSAARVADLLAAGHPVMTADLTGSGEIGECPHRFYESKSADEGIAVMLYLLGQSLVGVRAEDILICAQALSDTAGKHPVILCARGDLAIAGYHAYAAEPGLFESVETPDRPPAWAEVIHSADRFSFGNCVQNALRFYDWTELYTP